MTDQLLNLARGPDRRVNRYAGCTINGLRFHNKDREMHRRTQNSGIVVKGDHKGQSIDFYGVVRDVIELLYLGGNQVFLFKCDWWDVSNPKTGILKDKYNFVSVNVTKIRYKEDPFVLACQAEQVFYLNDMKLGKNWRVVQRTKPRAIYDMPQEKDEEEEKDEVYQQHEMQGYGETIDVDDSVELHRDDIDMIQVDMDIALRDEDDNEGDETLITSDSDMALDDDTDQDDMLINDDNNKLCEDL